MKIQKRAISLACLAALGMAGAAQAAQVAGEALEVYGNFYPEYLKTTFNDAGTGTLSTMTAGKNAPGVGATPPKVKDDVTKIDWVNSYIGLKGQKAFGDIRAGFDVQGVIMDGNTVARSALYGDARDAFVFVSHKKLGTLQAGQFDTVYKEFGDKGLLGTSSGNFTSTSGIVSAVTWKAPSANAAGTTSFNTRINGQVRWISPNWGGVEVGLTYRPDPARTYNQNASLSAMGARWSNETFTVALAQEVHNDYRTVSGTGVATDSATTIFSASPSSKDTATRLTLGYKAGSLRVGSELVSLKYTEDATIAGNFTSYETTAWQVSAEFNVSPQVTVGGNFGKSAAGSCSLLGADCSTDGLGGTMMSLGARYDLDKSVGFFALYGKSTVNSGAVLSSGNVGGDVTNMALGMQVRF